jgi:hypothetical protein
MQASNRGADPLREVLTRNGGAGPAPEQPRQSAQPPSGYAPAYPPQQQGGGYQQPAYQAPQGFPAGGGGDGGGRGPIQEQSLAPPR